jgi:hypothetical protein
MKKLISIVLAIFIALSCIVSPALAIDVTLAWDAVTTRNDNIPVTVQGYKVYQSNTPNVVVGSANLKSTTSSTTATITGLPNGMTYYWVVTAYLGEEESAKSSEISLVVAPAPLKAPTGLRITSK